MSRSRQNECAIGRAKRVASYPHPYPNGWYRLVALRSLERGEVRHIACLGREFAVGRRVDDGSVYVARGERQLPDRDLAETLPVQEVHGQVFLYYRGGEASQPVTEQPPYDIPRIPEVDTGQFVFGGDRDGGRIRMHLIEFAENSVDFAHFQIVHGRFRLPGTNIPVPGIGIHHTADWELDASRPWVSRFSDQVVLKFLGRRMPRAGATATITFTGPGSVVAFRFAIPGKGEIEMIQTHLPLAPLEQEVHFRWFADRRIPRLLVSYVVGNWIAQWRQDVQIWENKIYRATPALSSADGPIFRMRQWYQQFLPSENAAEIASG